MGRGAPLPIFKLYVFGLSTDSNSLILTMKVLLLNQLHRYLGNLQFF